VAKHPRPRRAPTRSFVGTSGAGAVPTLLARRSASAPCDGTDDELALLLAALPFTVQHSLHLARSSGIPHVLSPPTRAALDVDCRWEPDPGGRRAAAVRTRSDERRTRGSDEIHAETGQI
jgi:hypothetical protein